MSSENTLRTYSAYSGLKNASAAWRLLTARTGPAVLAILKTHMFDNKDVRMLRGAALEERLRGELELLIREPQDIPRTARSYIEEWVDKGYLMSEYLEGDDEERLWLSASAIDAIRFVEGIANPRSSVTESRLAIFIQALDNLSVDTDKDVARRLERLNAERERLDGEIARLEGGVAPILEDWKAIERTREIIALGSALAEDFGRVQEQHKALDRNLRARLIESTEGRSKALDDAFGELDEIHDSQPGRTFAAFHALLTDPAQHHALERSMEAIYQAAFFSELHPGERQFLKDILDILIAHSLALNKITSGLSQSLRKLVESRDFKQRSQMASLLATAIECAGKLSRHVNVTKTLDFHMVLPIADVSSVSRIQVRDWEDSEPPGPMRRAEGEDIDIGLVLLAIDADEIDLETLKANILSVLALLPKASIGDVLYHFPATEGLGSVVGLIHLAVRHGERGTGRETVSWRGADDVHRSAGIDKWFFSREFADDISV
ncbi:MAG: DUF3375 domain-containing protein [Deltaproteobacteria bacterium]|jgi:hypothetical protein|nr:DUF3375 domain-containing protein [Deltaproteobacteria bacterium]